MEAKKEQINSVYKELIAVELSKEKVIGTEDIETFLNNMQTRLEKKEEFKGANYEIKHGDTLLITTQEDYQFAIKKDQVVQIASSDGSGSGGFIRPPVIEDVKDIVFKVSPQYWTNTYAELEIEAPNYLVYDIEYTEDYSAEDWIIYNGKMKIEENKTIYARLRNSAGHSDIYGTQNIINIDKTPVSIIRDINLKEKNIMTKGFTIQIDVQDRESGLSQIIWNYKLKGTQEWKSANTIYKSRPNLSSGATDVVTKSYMFNNLQTGTYEVQAYIFDVAGNRTISKTIEVNI